MENRFYQPEKPENEISNRLRYAKMRYETNKTKMAQLRVEFEPHYPDMTPWAQCELEKDDIWPDMMLIITTDKFTLANYMEEEIAEEFITAIEARMDFDREAYGLSSFYTLHAIYGKNVSKAFLDKLTELINDGLTD